MRPEWDTKQSDAKFPVMLELWRMRSIPSLPSVPGPLWNRVVAPDSVISIGQIELNCVLLRNRSFWKRISFDIETVLTLNWIVWNRTLLTFNCVDKNILRLSWIIWKKWIAWNRNIFDNETILMLNLIFWNKTVYLYKNGFCVK